MGCTASTESHGVEQPARRHSISRRYSLHELLGQGAGGVVHRATDRGTGKQFAVKMVPEGAKGRWGDIANEVAMMQKLQHPTLARLHAVVPSNTRTCLVLELYPGGDMIHGMTNYWKDFGMIPMETTRNLSKQMWNAISYIHSQDCVHRDVKGDNFMMDTRRITHPNNKIYLSDFGTVCECPPEQRLAQRCGTVSYWSPELFQRNYSQKVDVWAVGVVMFGLVSGKFPFKGETEVRSKDLRIPARCPADGAELIGLALERRERKRPEAKKLGGHRFLRGAAAHCDAPAPRASAAEAVSVVEPACAAAAPA